MLANDVKDLLNEQINKELFSAYLYLDIANYYFDAGLNGFGNWFKIQAQEERDHANLFIQYLLNNSAKVNLTAIDAPNKSFTNFIQPLEASYEHELFVTASINTIFEAAYNKRDFRTMEFLNWFIKEQGEEEKNADELITKFNLFGNDSKGLYMLDNELAARVYAAPTYILD